MTTSSTEPDALGVFCNRLVIALDDLKVLPIKTVNGSIIYLRDVAQVRDGYAVQTNIVRENGAQAALLAVLRSASTVDIVNLVKAALYVLRSENQSLIKHQVAIGQKAKPRPADPGKAFSTVAAARRTWAAASCCCMVEPATQRATQARRACYRPLR